MLLEWTWCCWWQVSQWQLLIQEAKVHRWRQMDCNRPGLQQRQLMRRSTPWLKYRPAATKHARLLACCYIIKHQQPCDKCFAWGSARCTVRVSDQLPSASLLFGVWVGIWVWIGVNPWMFLHSCAESFLKFHFGNCPTSVRDIVCLIASVMFVEHWEGQIVCQMSCFINTNGVLENALVAVFIFVNCIWTGYL